MDLKLCCVQLIELWTKPKTIQLFLIFDRQNINISLTIKEFLFKSLHLYNNIFDHKTLKFNVKVLSVDIYAAKFLLDKEEKNSKKLSMKTNKTTALTFFRLTCSLTF